MAAAAVAYANSFSAPFVFDDHGSIIENPFLQRLWPLSAAASGPVQSAVAGRPVISLSLALNYAVTGLSASGFRAGNLTIHLLVGLILFGIIRRTLASPRLASRFAETADPLAAAVALVWLVHPLNSEVIDYVTQRTESIMGLFYLLTVYAAARAIAAGERPSFWMAISIGACALGMASKESMVTVPIVVVLYDILLWTGSLKRTWRARWPLFAGLALTWLILAALVVSGPRSHSAGFSSGMSPLVYFSSQPAMIVHYLMLAFWPHGFVLDYGVPHPVSWAAALPYALGLLALAVAALVNARRRPEVAFLGLWFFMTLAPTSSILPIATEVGAERRMYLPLMAVVAFIVIGAWSTVRRMTPLVEARRRALIAGAALAAICGVLIALTFQRNSEYQSRTGIWQTVVERRPHGRAHYNLGLEWKEQGNRSEAVRQYELALKDEPAAHYAIGFELDADGKHTEAIGHYREYIRLKPEDVNVIRAYVLLARDLNVTGQFEAAVDAYREALVRQPGNVDAWSGQGQALLGLRRYDEAIRAFREYGRLQPGDAVAHVGLGIALVGRGLESDAVPEFTRAVELAPDNPSTRQNLGNALASVGRLEEAEREYRLALALAPRAATIHSALGLVLAASARQDEALAEFKTAIALDPTNEQTLVDFATAFPGQDPARTLGRKVR